MINFLKGKVLRKKNNSVCVVIGNIGYEVILSPMHAAGVAEGSEIELIVHGYKREDADELYGFKSFKELDFFRMLVSVSGVGPKSAVNILSLGSVDETKSAIVTEDHVYLVRVSGIGKKTAERIVVELKDKIKDSAQNDSSSLSSSMKDVIEALEAMGYKRNEIQEVIRKIGVSSGDATEKLKSALQILGK